MKRAAILVLAIATLVLLGSPSAPLLADSHSKSVGTSNVVSPVGGSIDSGAPAGSGGGGSDEGDSDGLSGIKHQPSDQVTGAATMSAAERFFLTVNMWWRFMLWIR